MGRIVEKITIKGDPTSSGKEVLALFDTGSERSYVKKNILPSDVICSPILHFKTKFGGSTLEIKETCLLNSEIQGLAFNFYAYPIEEIGKIDGKGISVIIGALTMEEWDIRPYPKEKRMDLTALKKREFLEF